MTCEEFKGWMCKDVTENGTNAELAACINHYSTCRECRDRVEAVDREFEKAATTEEILRCDLLGAARRREAEQDPEFLETIKDNPHGEFHAESK